MLIVVLSVMFLLGLLALAYHLALFALFWTPAVLLGLLAMQSVQALGLGDPLAPLWPFLGGAMVGRLVMGRLMRQARLSACSLAPP
jgi:hypothetical protein